MAIDFQLVASQRELLLRSRAFAQAVLSPAIEAEFLPTPEEWFAATKPAYEAMIVVGFLRKCIPVFAGGESNSGSRMSACHATMLWEARAVVSR